MWLEKNNSSFFRDLQSKPFELQVWFVVMTIAGLRTLKSVVQDVTSSKINTTGLIIDLSILLIFCGLALLIYFRKDSPRTPDCGGNSADTFNLQLCTIRRCAWEQPNLT